MSRRRAKENKNYANLNYTYLTPDSGFVDEQFTDPPQEIPWKSLFLAGSLLIGGIMLLLVGSFIVSGYVDMKYSDRMWPMIILGLLMFIPGAYHIRIAYYAFKKVPGYSFSDIPAFD